MSWCMDSSCLQPSMGTAGATFQAALQFFAAQQCLIPEEWPSYAPKDGDSFDFIVVGAGSAGATLAARLAEVSHWRVLLVEAGDSPPVESTIPAFSNSLYGTRYDWNFTTAENWDFYRGHMLGGSSSINGMVYVRGNPEDYNLWAANGNEGWDWDSVLPYFKKTENMTDNTVLETVQNSELHSTQGPVLISRAEEFNLINDDVIKAFQEIGIPRRLEINGPIQLGVTTPHLTAYNGIRQSTAEVFLKDNITNLFIAKNTYASKVLFDKNLKAEGVELILDDDSHINVYASSEIVLSGGVVGTPQILLLSGVGPKSDLESVGIPLKVDLPVGENFFNHYTVTIYMTGLNNPENEANQYFEQIQYLYNRTGQLSINRPNTVIGSFRADDNFDQGRPDYQFYNIYTPAKFYKLADCNASDDRCTSLAAISENNDLYRTVVSGLHPKSKGKVSLKTNTPTEKPIIETNIFADADDLDGLVNGIERLLALVNTSYFSSMDSRIVELNVTKCNNFEFKSREYWKCYAVNTGVLWYHGTGTCAMGPEGVVDAKAKVKGTTGLRLADISIAPVSISGNTNAAAMMIGEKVADIIKEEYLQDTC